MVEVEVEKANKVYARIIEVLTIIGLIVMVVGLVLYLSGSIPVFVDLDKLAEFWGCSAPKFWKAVRGEELSQGYEWIITNLNFADIISVLGVVLLPIGVIIGIIATIALYGSKRDIMVAVAVAVFIIMLIAVFLPYLGVAAGH